MIDAPLQLVIEKRPKGTRPMVSKAVRDAWELQQLMMRDARADDTTPAVRATLARSWCLVQECIRVMRGIPLPGQLRPDLPPMKGLKGKRGKGSPVLDLPAAQAFSEAVEKVKAEARAAGANLDDEPEPSITTKHTQNASSGLTTGPKTLPNTLRSKVSESVKPEVNPPESKTRATPPPKPSTKPAPKTKE